jgi:hypothetical protein
MKPRGVNPANHIPAQNQPSMDVSAKERHLYHMHSCPEGSARECR